MIELINQLGSTYYAHRVGANKRYSISILSNYNWVWHTIIILDYVYE